MPRIAANAGCPPVAPCTQVPCTASPCAPSTASYQLCAPCTTDLHCCYTDLTGFDVACREFTLTGDADVTLFNLAVANTVTVQKVHINAGGVKRFAAYPSAVFNAGNPTVTLPKGSYNICLGTVDADTKLAVEYF